VSSLRHERKWCDSRQKGPEGPPLDSDFDSECESESSLSSSYFEMPILSGISRASERISPKPGPPGFPEKKVKGLVPWELSPCPLSFREEKTVIAKGRWLFKLPYGEYKVFPLRADVKSFQWKFWLSRELRQILSIMAQYPLSILIEDLMWVRNTVLKFLNNGTPRLTSLQKRIMSSVHYLLRRCKTDYKSSGKALLEQSALAAMFA